MTAPEQRVSGREDGDEVPVRAVRKTVEEDVRDCDRADVHDEHGGAEADLDGTLQEGKDEEKETRAGMRCSRKLDGR
jgi:hypothetical protein